jgi:tetratricopeptide (TPR) repeat protein
LVQGQRWPDLAKLSEDRLKTKDSVLARIALAKAYDKLGRTAEVEKQVETAAQMNPPSLLAHTAQAALRLKQATEERDLIDVGATLVKLQQSLYQSATAEEKTAFEFLIGLYFGLAGNRQEAAGFFRRLIEANPNEPDYRQAYEALGM